MKFALFVSKSNKMKERIEISLDGVTEGEIEELRNYLTARCWNWTIRHIDD